MFICATDEHGTPAELAAAKVNKPIEQFCAEMYKIQKKLSDGFNLSFDGNCVSNLVSVVVPKYWPTFQFSRSSI